MNAGPAAEAFPVKEAKSWTRWHKDEMSEVLGLNELGGPNHAVVDAIMRFLALMCASPQHCLAPCRHFRRDEDDLMFFASISVSSSLGKRGIGSTTTRNRMEVEAYSASWLHFIEQIHSTWQLSLEHHAASHPMVMSSLLDRLRLHDLGSAVVFLIVFLLGYSLCSYTSLLPILLAKQVIILCAMFPVLCLPAPTKDPTMKHTAPRQSNKDTNRPTMPLHHLI